MEWIKVGNRAGYLCPRCRGLSRYRVPPEICAKCGWQAPIHDEPCHKTTKVFEARRTRPMTKCKLCGETIKDGQMVFALVVAIEGEKVKAKWCFCTDCVLQKIGKAVEAAGIKILPELVAKFLAG